MLQPLAIAIIAGVLVQLPLVLLVMPVAVRLAERSPSAGTGSPSPLDSGTST